MPITQSELQRFRQFVVEKTNDGGGDLTPGDCLRPWRSEQETAESIAAIQRGIDDAEAGRMRSLDQVDADIRNELGFSPRKILCDG